MNWIRTIADGLIMAAYFNLFAAAVVIYDVRLMFPCYPKELIEAAELKPTKEENRFYWIWILFGELIPLLLFGAVSSVNAGISGFWSLFFTAAVEWLFINFGDLFILDYLGIKKFRDRITVPGTEGHEMYEMKNWMKKYALPEHLIQWPLFMIPLMAAAQAGLALLFS